MKWCCSIVLVAAITAAYSPRAMAAAKTVVGFDEERAAPEPEKAPEKPPEELPPRVRTEPEVEARPEPAPVAPEPAIPRQAPGRPSGGLGVRAGVLVPGKGKQEEYDPGLTVGLFWQRRRGENARLGYELELGYGQTEAESGAQTNTLLALRANALWTIRGGGYAAGGLTLAQETVDDDDFGKSTATGSSLDVGGGVEFSGVDIRLTWSFLVGSDNVDDLFAATVGYVF